MFKFRKDHIQLTVSSSLNLGNKVRIHEKFERKQTHEEFKFKRFKFKFGLRTWR